jgi:methionyl-tRNA synthetase
VARNNNELGATWGNLANRVLAFCHKNWEGYVPDFGRDGVSPSDDKGTQGRKTQGKGTLPLRDADFALLATVENGFNTVGAELEAVRLRSALGEAMKLATAVNQYLDQTAPWTAIKTDHEAASKTIYTALKAIDSLKVLFAPFLPFTSERLHGFFGYETPLFGEQYTEKVKDSLGEHTVLRYRAPQHPAGKGVEGLQWKPSELKPGAKLNLPAPLYKKLDEKVVEEERARLGR